jgi:hypothetical protein
MWEPGEILKSVEGFHPVPAQRDATDRAAQARLHGYLTRLTGQLLPLPSASLPLFLHLHVAVPRATNLLHGYDLERFLTPLFGARWLTAGRFVLVMGTKSAEGTSRLSIGLASELPASRSAPAGSRTTPAAAPASPEWIEQLRRALARVEPVPLPDGPVRLLLEFACAQNRNWVSLWRPAGEAMGPILGYDRSLDAHHPRTDRLMHLEFHRRLDDRLADAVEVVYRWTLMPLEVA